MRVVTRPTLVLEDAWLEPDLGSGEGDAGDSACSSRSSSHTDGGSPTALASPRAWRVPADVSGGACPASAAEGDACPASAAEGGACSAAGNGCPPGAPATAGTAAAGVPGLLMLARVSAYPRTRSWGMADLAPEARTGSVRALSSVIRGVRTPVCARAGWKGRHGVPGSWARAHPPGPTRDKPPPPRAPPISPQLPFRLLFAGAGRRHAAGLGVPGPGRRHPARPGADAVQL